MLKAIHFIAAYDITAAGIPEEFYAKCLRVQLQQCLITFSAAGFEKA